MIDAGEKKPGLDPDEYTHLAQAIGNRFGLHFPEKRRGELERGLLQAFAASSCQDLGEYFRLLQDPEAGGLEMDRLVNALTVGETYFFRDAGQFDALYNHVLPQIIERRRMVRTLRIWSAGCASGEEPYSLAMMLREILPDVDEWAITILGTDINTEALHRARTAVYGEWAFREERARQWRGRYFRPVEKRWALAPEVQRMVTFRRLNLAGESYPAFETNTTLMDLVMCRNVTIYFDEPVTRHVADRLYDALVDGAWLVVGHSEPSPITYKRFEARNFPNAVLYQRTAHEEWQTAGWAVWTQPPPPPARQPLAVPAPRPAPAPQTTNLLVKETAQEDPLEQARELLEYGHSERARDLLLDAAARRPRHAPTYALLGRAYANLGNWQEAERWCREAIGLDRLALEAYYTLSLVLQHQGKIREALDAMKKVVYIDRHSILGHFGLAGLYHSLEQWPQALKGLDNTRRILDTLPADAMISGSGGISAGRLLETVVRQQQQWQARAHGR